MYTSTPIYAETESPAAAHNCLTQKVLLTAYKAHGSGQIMTNNSRPFLELDDNQKLHDEFMQEF